MKYYGKAEAVADKVIKAFETGNVPKAIAPIFISKGGRHCDSYSWMNQLIVALAGWTDAMGYGGKDKSSGWLSVGRRVRQGERATYILAPCIRTVDDPKAESGKKRILYGFRSAAVFGIEQTDVEDAELWAKHNKGGEDAEKFLADLPLREVAEAWGYTLGTYNAQRARALGWHRRGASIAIGVKNLDVWAHELVHAADFKNGKLVERGQHWRSEVVAELGSTILMYAMGYDTEADLGGAYKYIKNYSRDAGIEMVKACTDVLNRACSAVATILETAERVNGGDKYTTPDGGDKYTTPDGGDKYTTPESDESMAPESDTALTVAA